MKLMKALFVLTVVCALFTATATASTSTTNLSVTASVGGACVVSTNAVSFGSYDPLSANASAALNGTGTVTVTCTNGTDGTITLGEGANADSGSSTSVPLRRMSDGAGNFLSYFLYQDPSRNNVWANTAGTGSVHNGDGTSTALTVWGQVTGGQNVPAGSYSDTVVVTITF
jgi:spore coat protein U-like protein